MVVEGGATVFTEDVLFASLHERLGHRRPPAPQRLLPHARRGLLPRPRQGPNRAKNALPAPRKNIDLTPNDVRQSPVRVASICRSSVALLWRSVT